MKLIKVLSVLAISVSLVGGAAFAAEKSGEKTCCEKASVNDKECTHKCCVTAHKEGKSCEKCNPNKEDTKLKKKGKKSDKSADKAS